MPTEMHESRLHLPAACSHNSYMGTDCIEQYSEYRRGRHTHMEYCMYAQAGSIAYVHTHMHTQGTLHMCMYGCEIGDHAVPA